MNNASRTLDEELKAKDRQIQELKEELAKSRRREEILESLCAAQESYRWRIGYYAGLRASSRGAFHRIKSMLSEDDLHDVLRAYLEKEMDAEEERFLHIQTEIEEKERKYNELVKPLNDELDALE